MSEISEGETDEKVREIETFDFDGSNREQLLCKIQQGLHEMQNELQFHRNLKGKHHNFKSVKIICSLVVVFFFLSRTEVRLHAIAFVMYIVYQIYLDIQ